MLVAGHAGSVVQVLIVDPDRELVELLAYMLQRAGLRYALALDTTSAVALFVSLRPSVVIVDTNGFDLLAHFSDGSHHADIIVLRTGGDEEARVSALEQGAVDYVTKPFSPRELLARVRACLRRSERDSAGAAAPASVANGALSACRWKT